MKRLGNLKNKIITCKVENNHKKAYKIISITVAIVLLPFFLFGYVLDFIRAFAEIYCDLVMGIMSTVRNNIFKFIYFDECRTKELDEKD